MKKRFIRITIVAALLLGSLFTPLSTHAAPNNSTTQETAESKPLETTFFGNVQDDGQGCGVFKILNLVLDIFTGAVGIVAVVGISIAGVQYLTSRGNEQEAAKAKRRLFEIIIGIVAFVLIYSGINWLLPGGKFNSSTNCSNSASTACILNKSL